ncbi:MAG: hypothetical protein JSU07_01500 [Bacteroidetes bacterium]|nr:hypothetical protein [Bacteroidota bacterium]
MKIFIPIFSVFFLLACNHKTNFSALPQVSFAKDIQPLIASNCTMAGCHSPTDNLITPLQNYVDIAHYVSPGNPNNSKLYNVITALNNDVMPKKPYPPLPPEQIGYIYTWIGQGAKNN